MLKIIIILVAAIILFAAIGTLGEYLIRYGKKNNLIKSNYEFYEGDNGNEEK